MMRGYGIGLTPMWDRAHEIGAYESQGLVREVNVIGLRGRGLRVMRLKNRLFLCMGL